MYNISLNHSGLFYCYLDFPQFDLMLMIVNHNGLWLISIAFILIVTVIITKVVIMLTETNRCYDRTISKVPASEKTQ